MTGAAPSRHAVYFAPPADHPLWRLGCDWLGRDPTAGVTLTGPARAAVEAPWRYGFHATLKAPLTLADGASEAQWLAAVRALAARQRAFDMPTLHVATLADFIALRPQPPITTDHPLRRLADACVLELDRWRRPPSAADRARLSWPAMSAGQRRNVERFGYAHVLDAWRFHLTLTNRLEAKGVAAIDALRLEAERHFAAALRLPLRCDALCVFVEPAPGQPFVLRHRFPLGPA